ncbi:MAG: gamma-glutamyltransferase family protein [Hyphomicrobiaceae bacterium]
MAGFTTRPEILGTFGVVTSTHWIASAIGMATLEKGGNAFDAAVATGFALQVVEPHLNGPLGEAPVMVFDVRRGKPEVICGQGVAPAAASIEKFRELDLDMIPGTGLLPACVPGAFDAWMVLLRDYGTMPLADVLSPAIALAGRGYPVVPRMTETIETVQELFTRHWKTSAAVFMPGGKPAVTGTIHTNPALAETYARVLAAAQAAGGNREKQIEAARDAWYRGFVAEAVDAFCRTEEVMDVSGRPHKGLLTADDMARWQAKVEAPLSFKYGRYDVLKCGAWSQGPSMLQQLSLVHGFALDGMSPTSPEWVHIVTECAKLAYADRDTFYGDPDFVEVPMEALLSRDYNARRRNLIQTTASHDFIPGKIEGYERSVIDYASAATRQGPRGSLGAGEPTVGKMGETKGDTVHFDIIDKDGNMVSATPSGGWLHSSPVIPALGFPLGTRGQMFLLDPSSASALVPGKRPRSTLSPGLVLRDGEPYMGLGTPGGDQQDQWATQLFLRHVHAGMNLQEAIDCPAFHTEHFPSSFWPRTARPGVVVVEGRMPKDTVKELIRRGHKVEVGGDWSEGRLTAAARDGRMLKAAANPLGMQGYAIGR